MFGQRCQQAFAVRRRRVPPTTNERWLPSLLFNAASEALAMQETMAHGDVALDHDAEARRVHRLVTAPWEEASLDVFAESRRFSGLTDCGIIVIHVLEEPLLGNSTYVSVRKKSLGS